MDVAPMMVREVHPLAGVEVCPYDGLYKVYDDPKMRDTTPMRRLLGSGETAHEAWVDAVERLLSTASSELAAALTEARE